MYTMRKRSKEFFQRNVKTLKLESHEPLARINTVISLCQSIDTLELLSLSTPEATDEPSELLDYFDNLTKLTIRHLVINLDCHLRSAALLHLDFPFVIFENLTHLDVVCAENRQFVNNVLPIMLRLQRLIINPWKYTISYEQLLVFVSNIKDNFPLSLELCAIFIHHPPTATEHLITRPKLVEVARGTTDRRIALAFPFDRLNNLQDKGLWERNGYRSLLSSWCLIGPGSPDVWQQMDEILRQRRGKRGKPRKCIRTHPCSHYYLFLRFPARLTMYERINDAPTSQVLVWYPPQRNTP